MATAKKSPAPKRQAKPATAPVAAVSIKVDRAIAQAWKKQLAVLESSQLEGMKAWDQKYEAVGAVLAHDPPLYLAGGVATDGAFFAKYLPGEDSRTILRNVRVAKHASPEDEAHYGTSKIDAVMDYLEAKHGPAKARVPIDFQKLRLDTGKGSVTFTHASVAEVRTAARLASRSSKNGAKKPAKRNPIVEALTAKLPKAAKGVTVHFSGGRVTLGAIPLEAFSAVLRALAAVRLPEQA